ncbi:MAG: TIGR04372 family glycosyltransferase [Acidobacteriota bacterium]
MLLVQPQASSFGKVVGFGNLIRNVAETLDVARQFDLTVALVRPSAPLNKALFDIDVDGARVLPSRGPEAALRTVLWAVSAPFRRGAPAAWFARQGACLLTAVGSVVVRRARRWPKPRRQAAKALLAPHMTRAAATRAQYARRVSEDWRALVREAAKRQRKASRRNGPGREVVRLRSDIERRTERTASLLGLDPSTRIVTLHVRESGYRSTHGFRERSFDDTRNARIEDYALAVDLLVSRGYTVVRIGDPSMTPFARKGMIDLATSPFRDDWVEFWCLQRSDFFIASDSGPFYWAELFGFPRLAVNLVQFGAGAAGARDRFVPKLVVDRGTGRRLAIREMLSDDFLRTGRDPGRYTPVDNSPEDLRDAVEDMLGVLRGDEPWSEGQRCYHERMSAVVQGEHWRAWHGDWSIIVRPEWHGRISRRFSDRYY